MVAPSLVSPQDRFLSALTPNDLATLQGLHDSAPQDVPSENIAWWCGLHFMGYLAPSHAIWLCENLSNCLLGTTVLNWSPPVHSWVERSEALQNVLIKAKESGLILGWRDEAFSFWSSECIYPDTNRTPFIAVERSGFRYLGMLSHAVHINGFTSEGKMWCGRRSLQKTVDPGLLDNVSAGGLTSGDNLHQCATRELQEEAGLLNLPTGALSDMGSVRISRMRPEGWHEEVLHVFNLDLPDDFEPVNQDGEVTEFLCLAPLDLLERIRNCEFTLDAALAIAQGLSRGNVQTQKNHDLAS